MVGEDELNKKRWMGSAHFIYRPTLKSVLCSLTTWDVTKCLRFLS